MMTLGTERFYVSELITHDELLANDVSVFIYDIAVVYLHPPFAGEAVADY